MYTQERKEIISNFESIYICFSSLNSFNDDYILNFKILIMDLEDYNLEI